MRELLSDTEAARIPGKRRTRTYRILDLFGTNGDDEWELEEELDFAFPCTVVSARQGQKQLPVTEESVKALVRNTKTI